MKPYLITDELKYRNYAYNRMNHPEIKPEEWGEIIEGWEDMEARFQEELNDKQTH